MELNSGVMHAINMFTRFILCKRKSLGKSLVLINLHTVHHLLIVSKYCYFMIYSKWIKTFAPPPRFPKRTHVKPLFVECL